MAVTTYCYHENVHRTMRTAIVSDLLKPNYCKQPFRENPKNSFIAQFDYSRAALGGQTCDHLRDVPLENVFKLSASAAATEFCEWA